MSDYRETIRAILKAKGITEPSATDLESAWNDVINNLDQYDDNTRALLAFVLLAHGEFKDGSRLNPFNSILGLRRKKTSLLDSPIHVGEPIGNIYLDHRLKDTSKQACIEAFIEHLHIERTLAHQVYKKAHDQLSATANDFIRLTKND